MHPQQNIIDAINNFPLNRGLRGEDWVADPDNVAIVHGDDFALFDAEGGGVFQVHFLYQVRGREAIRLAKESFRRMFEERGAEMIFGMVPSDMANAKMHARLIGGRFVGVRATPFGNCDLFVLPKEIWRNS